MEYQTFPIEPDVTSLRHLDLFPTVGSVGCLTVGERRFELPISILNGGDRTSADRGFSVALA